MGSVGVIILGHVLGDALQGKRDKVVLVSKFGHTPDGRTEFHVSGFRESLEGSLRRLRTDYLDALLLHNPPGAMYGGTDPLWDALEEARLQGKIRHYGASLDFAAEVEECLSNTKSSVLEVLFNIFHQDVRRAFAQVRQKGAGTIVKVPLDSGWLTGRFDASSRFEGIRARWSEEQIEQRSELVSRIRWLVADGSELAHKAIGYLLSYGEVSCVIPGMRTLEQLESNLAAANCRISPADRGRLEELWDDVTENGSDEIKIDRSFITDIHKRPRSQGILRAIESLSEALGMTVIAEGIESYEELTYLQAATKIRYAQGFYFAKPIFLEDLKPATPVASEARASMAARPAQEGRQSYSRASGFRR